MFFAAALLTAGEGSRRKTGRRSWRGIQAQQVATQGKSGIESEGIRGCSFAALPIAFLFTHFISYTVLSRFIT